MIVSVCRVAIDVKLAHGYFCPAAGCLHNATCTEDPSQSSFTCNCGPNYEGVYCEDGTLLLQCQPIFSANVLLTLWRPLLPYGYSYNASCARVQG